MQQCREGAKRPKTTRTVLVQGLGEVNGHSFPKLCDVARQIEVKTMCDPNLNLRPDTCIGLSVFTPCRMTLTQHITIISFKYVSGAGPSITSRDTLLSWPCLSCHRNLIGIFQEDGNVEDITDDMWTIITTRTTTRSTMTFIVSIMCSLPDDFHMLHISVTTFD